MDIASFAQDIREWYNRYYWVGRYHKKKGYPPDCYANGFPWMTVLENRLSLKARNGQGLHLDDLVEIAEWGGGQRGLTTRLRKHNTPEGIRNATARACADLDSPDKALRGLLEGISHWGLTYSSKTLMFVCPKSYPALDSRLREGLGTLLPSIYDGKGQSQIRSQVKGYLSFIEICRDVQKRVQSPGPRNGEWFLADIETAMFQFVSDGHRF